MIRVGIIDDHAVVRMGMRYAIEMDPELVFAGDFGGGEGAVEWVKEVRPDVLLLDIYMPRKNGLQVLDELRLWLPGQKVIMLTTSAADDDAYQALRHGASGYLLKDRDADDIYTAIKTVAAGGRYVPEAVRALVEEREKTPNPTPRELKVLEMVVKGRSNEEIAAALKLSVSSIKNDIKSLFAKLGAEDRVGIATAAIERGFVKL